MNIQRYNKAIAAVLTPALIALLISLLEQAGVTVDDSVKSAVAVVVTGFLVWLVPNQEGK